MGKLAFKDLAGLSAKQLQALADERGFGLKFNKSHTKADMRKKILQAQTAAEADAVEAGNGTPAGDKLDANPAFENMLTQGSGFSEELTPAHGATEFIDNRGGARPGAGRPPGMTAEIARYNALSQQPNPAIVDAFEMLFAAWATAARCPGVALTTQEAMDIALPWTQVLELMGVAQRIPPWVVIAITCGWNTLSIVKAKANLARQAKQDREGKDHAEKTSTVVAA